MIESIINPFRLSAMTLRGVGSYLHGQKLDIQPLTILCGTNGSGKSTWFDVLRLLREKCESSYFPFSLGIGDDYRLTKLENACLYSYHLDRAPTEQDRDSYARILKSYDSPEEEADYGPLGTIGIHVVLTRPLTTDEIGNDYFVDIPMESAAARYFWKAEHVPGTELRIRITPPELSPYGAGHIDLAINGNTLCHFSLAGPYRRYPSWFRPVINTSSPDNVMCARYEGFISRELIAWSDAICNDLSPTDSTMLPLGTIRFNLETYSVDTKSQIIRSIWECCMERVQNTVINALSGIFSLGAIRKTLQSDEIIKSLTSTKGEHYARKRYVAHDGSMTHQLIKEYSTVAMAQAMPPYTGFFDNRLEWLAKHVESDISVYKQVLGLSSDVVVSPYLFEHYYGMWMKRLVDVVPTRSGIDAESLADDWKDDIALPNGFLLPILVPDEVMKSNEYEINWHWYSRYFHPCLYSSGNNVDPGNLSAGFHQIAPIVVQLGLMHKHESCCIENPEVHLHPALQIRLMDFLIREANTGKQVIIETHSDLVVNRVLQAILEEELINGQNAIRIYFASLKNINWKAYSTKYDEEEIKSVAYSQLEPIQVDKNGRIANWPPGFMDEQIKQSRRLLDLMYGRESKDNGGETQ